MPAEELLFQPTPGFGPSYEPYLDHAKSHPAKMNMWLLEWLIKAFTKPGETVLDPMAGSGSMGVVAALHGRNAVQVELEKKFYDWMEKAKGNIEKNAAIQQKGWIKNILGDARCLSQLLRDVDICITSPPYAETYTGGGDPEKRRKRLIKAGHNPKDFLGGKARNAVLKHYTEVDTVITSPPYSESITKRRKGYTVIPELKKTREMPQDTKDDNIANLPHGTVAAIITSPPYERQHQGGYDTPKIRHGCIKERYPNAENIGNLHFGGLPQNQIDCCVTSPPYMKSAESGAGVNRQREGDVKIGCSTVDRTVTHPDAIDNTKVYGEISAIITSPPYEASVSDGKESPLVGGDEKKYGRWRKGTARKHSYTKHGEPCKVDTVITSPPYEGSLEGTTRHTRGGIASRDPTLAQTGSYATVMSFGVPVGYSPNPENIGNLKSSDWEYEALAKGLMKNGKPTYLSEMLKVYAEMYRVLKPGGLAIIVVKPFIRNKKVVDLPYHTWHLMVKVGFRLAKLYKLRLKQHSFWRILLYKKHPEVLVIAHEYVLVCRKPSSEPSDVKPQISPLDFVVEMVARKTALKIRA